LRRTSTSLIYKQLAILLLVGLLASCSLEKQSAVNRGLQNLTAHYNILFNANQILQEKQETYQTAYIDNYNELLSLYQDTMAHSEGPDKTLDAAIAKANTIISTKEQSHYIGDAYLVLGKANHLYGHYFNSAEFFKYTIASYPQKTQLVQEARVWLVRSLLYLDQLDDAKVVLDSALKNINPKKAITADVYATATQYHINKGEYADAEAMDKLAVKYAHNKQQRQRWTFILAQLQELNKEPTDAYNNYSRVVKSNASFEMAFNADLNRIRLEDEGNGRQLSRMQRLQRLLRNDNNLDFTDQIYYQMALLYLANNDIDNAIKNLQRSVQYSTKNQTQKGLSYLRLADINFKNKADYVMSKKYYDSTLMNISPSYPDYTLIRKKSDNLQILADQLNIIANQDTLQMLARLDEKQRAVRIAELVKQHTVQQQVITTAAGVADPFNNNYNNNIASLNNSNRQATNNNSSFYFYNSASISQGYTDFKRIWGNRKLEDNWRRSKRTGGNITANSVNLAQTTNADVVPNQDVKSIQDVSADTYKQHLLQDLPLTPQLLSESNRRVYNAYMNIANFYRDVLDDKKDAIETYLILLSRFPDDPERAVIYYNLYRLYTETNDSRADEYKNLVLKNYPSSVYARVIADPDYYRKLNDKDAAFNTLYDEVYDLYTQREYQRVIAKTDSLLTLYPTNKFAAQLSYLRTIANGHQEKLAPFVNELLQITSKYPDDKLIIPLVNQHLIYIDANKQKMAARQFALMDVDPNEEPFIPATVQQPALAQTYAQQQRQSATLTKPVPSGANNQQAAAKQPVAVNNPPAVNAIAPPVKTSAVKSIFSLKDSTNYYFVVNVSSGTTNLSSSRFGIGQFNRANLPNNGIRHQLKNAGPDNQLIYVGRFYSLDAVKEYARAIAPLMPDIMKVQADKYMFFIITQENLDKLADKKTLDSYIDFYQKNY